MIGIDELYDIGEFRGSMPHYWRNVCASPVVLDVSTVLYWYGEMLIVRPIITTMDITILLEILSDPRIQRAPFRHVPSSP